MKASITCRAKNMGTELELIVHMTELKGDLLSSDVKKRGKKGIKALFTRSIPGVVKSSIKITLTE